MSRQLRILLVDEKRFRKLLALHLKSYGHVVDEADDYETAVQLLETQPRSFDLAIIDYSLEGRGPARTGLELLRHLRQLEPNFPVIIITGVGDRKISQEVLRAGAFWYLNKPPDWVELEMLLKWVGRYRATSGAPRPPKPELGTPHPWLPVSDAIVSATRISDLTEAVSTKALIFLEADRCGILVVNTETGEVSGLPETEGEKPALFLRLEETARQLIAQEEVPSIIWDEEPDHDGLLSAVCMCPPQSSASGVLYALFRKSGEGNLSEVRRLDLGFRVIALARMAGVALDHLRQTAFVEGLVQSGKSLLETRTEDQAYKIVAHQILRSFEVSTFYLALYDRASNQISFPLFYDKGKELDSKPLLDLNQIGPHQSLTIYTLLEAEERGVEISNIDRNPYPTRSFPVQGLETHSFFAVQLRMQDGTPFGVLSIQGAIPWNFPESLKQALRALATLVAPTLQRLRQARLQESILDHLMTGNPRAVLQESLQSLWEAVNADFVVFYPYDARRSTFRLDQIDAIPYLPSLQKPEEETSTLSRLLKVGKRFAAQAADDKIFGSVWHERYSSKSVAGVTLRPSGSKTPTGIIVVHYRKARGFDHELRADIARFSQFAAVAAHLLQQQERQRSEEKRREILGSLADISDSALLAQTLEETLPDTWPGYQVLCRFLLADRGKRELFSPRGQWQSRAKIPFGTPHLAGHVAEVGEFLLLQNLDLLLSYETFSHLTRSALYLPVKLGDSLLGVLSLESPQEDLFQPEDRLFLEQIARSAATFLAAAGRKERADAVMKAAALAASDPEHGLEIVTRSAHEIASNAGGSPTSTTVYLLTGNALELVSAWPPDLFEDLRSQVGSLPLEVPAGQPRGFVALAALERTSQLVHLPNDDYIRFNPKTQAELAVPVLSVDRSVVGVLNLEYSKPEALNEQDRSLMELLADQAAVVAALYQKHLAHAEEQKNSLIAATLAIAGLSEADHAHRLINLDTPLEGIRNEIPTLRDLWNRLLARMEPTRSAQVLNNEIEVSLRAIEKFNLQILNDLQQQTVAERDAENLEFLSVSEWLNQVKRDWIGKAPLALNLDIDLHYGISANRYWLTRGLDNLLKNSERALVDRPDAQISITAMKFGDRARITISDNGSGISPRVVPHLFSSRIPESRPKHGIGCLLTHFIVHFYKGRIILPIETSEKGTRITLEFPIEKILNFERMR